MGGRGSSSASSVQSAAAPPSLAEARAGETAVFIYDIPHSGNPRFPSDILRNPQNYLEPYLDNKKVVESVRKLRNVQDFPGHTVTVYHLESAGGGEWVTLSKTYAEELAGGGKVTPFQAKATELTWDGKSWLRFGHWGRK